MATVAERFWAKVDKRGAIPKARPDLGPCWLWTASTHKGYGKFNAEGRTRRAHVWAWEQLNGPVPPGLELDHLCRVGICVRPSHLEAVTHAENVRRGVGRAPTHCPKGHPYDEANTKVRKNGRGCRTCLRESERERRRRVPQ